MRRTVDLTLIPQGGRHTAVLVRCVGAGRPERRRRLGRGA